MRINKFIAHSGFSSRRKADELIKEKRVKVNGKIVEDFSLDVNSSDIVLVDDKRISDEEKVYYMLNKPVGYISSNYDPHNKKRVIDLINTKKRIYPVGRLDKDSKGLIFLTNDGEITNLITHPANKIDKEYIVRVDRRLTEDEIFEFKNGIKLEEKTTEKCSITLLNSKKFIYKVIIHEGLNRQIRRMFEYFNVKVKVLKRVKIGEISLDNLQEGKYRKLNSKELEYLRSLK
ncbi:MAG: pseudouridine synthase [Tissierellia bacterium]|nr:pseudouridine synthase [Tissierellia bacterium]